MVENELSNYRKCLFMRDLIVIVVFEEYLVREIRNAYLLVFSTADNNNKLYIF